MPCVRIRFTAEDLLLTRFVTRPAPLLELSMSIATVLRRDPLFARMSYAGAMTEFVRPNGTAPLFMDPMSVGLADGLDRVLSTPRDYVRCQLRQVPATAWARALYNFDRDAWQMLAKALTTYAKANPTFTFKAGMVEGRVIDVNAINDLASLPSKEEILSKLLFLINAPAQRLATAIGAVGRNLAVVLDQACKENKFTA